MRAKVMDDGVVALLVPLPGVRMHFGASLCPSKLGSGRCEHAATEQQVEELLAAAKEVGGQWLITPRANGAISELNTTLSLLERARAMLGRRLYVIAPVSNPFELAQSDLAKATISNPQCGLLLNGGAFEAQSDGRRRPTRAECMDAWGKLAPRLDWYGDPAHIGSYSTLVRQLAERSRGGFVVADASVVPEAEAQAVPLRSEVEAAFTKHSGDWFLYRQARREHFACMRGGHYERGAGDEPPYADFIYHKAIRGTPPLTQWRNWSWTSAECPSLNSDLSPARMCDAFAHRKVLWIGDSLGFQTFISFNQLLGKQAPNPGFRGRWFGEVESNWMGTAAQVGCGGNVTYNFARNDWLSTAQWDRGCVTWNQLFHVCCRAWTHLVQKYDTLFLSAGDHVQKPESRWTNNVLHLANFLATNVSTATHLVWRNPPMGHVDCAQRTDPLDYSYKPPAKHHYGWDLLEPRDDAAFEILESFMPRRMHYVDAQRLSSYRPDRHVVGPKRDCLHYLLPGPPDDHILVFKQIMEGITRTGV